LRRDGASPKRIANEELNNPALEQHTAIQISITGLLVVAAAPWRALLAAATRREAFS
jgi:hypothetical protein